MRTVAFSNRKGGSGKTSLAVNLADGLARRGQRTLVVDLDGQQNATKWLLGRTFEHDEPGSPEVLLSGVIGEQHVYEAPGRENLWVLPSTTEMDQTELAVAQAPAGQMNLRHALAGVSRRFDWVLIDCAPNLGTGTLSALCAAKDVLVPILPAFLTLEGVAALETVVSRLRKGFRVPTRVSGYVLFAVDARESLGVEARESLEGGRLYEAAVRISTEGKRLPERRTTAWDDGEDPRGHADYEAVLGEMLKRITR